jgi:hypothetical protein
MSRERPAAVPAMSLFPFIAVLLCTMGALLVLLVIFSRAAKETARAGGTGGPPAAAVVANEGPEDAPSVGPPPEPMPDPEDLERQRAALRARVDAAESLKRQAEERLREARLRLAGIEENARDLRLELDRHVSVVQSLQEPGPPPPDDLDALAKSLDEAEQSLAAARQSAEGRPAAYAVVPYVGPSGTRRRPLYIECSFDGVFLQPEGVRLTPSDFEGPPGPGNPLASALRAAREYLVTTSQATSVEGEQPYPLLIVRPSGVMAYYAARESLSSWGSDFGYQLIDEDWTLAFPPADPVLADLEQQAVAEARARLEWLSQRRPRTESKPKTTYRAATTRGGVVETGGASLLGDPERFEWRERSPSEDGVDGRPRGQGTAAMAASRERGGGFGQADASGQGPAGGGGRAGSAETGQAGSMGDWAAGSGAGRGAGDAAARSSLPAASTGSPTAAGTADGSRRGSAEGLAGSEGMASSGSAGDGGRAFSPTSAGASGGGAAAAAGSAGAQGAGGGSGQPAGASGSLSVPLAGVRGANWASLATRDRPIPLTRPILVECTAHEFRIYDDARRRVVERVPIAGATELAVDPLVRHVQERVTSWGIAGERMYWRPQLLLAETPDGLGRRQDLERLLDGSGLDTRIRAPEVAPLPSVRSPTSRSMSRSEEPVDAGAAVADDPRSRSARARMEILEVGG